jgi:hypothetical protein
VTYADVDNDAASYVLVHIDSDTTGVAMTKSGSVYTYSTTLDKGSHTYYFTASDGTDTAREPSTGSSSGPTVTNTAPTLSSGSVSPGTGDTTTTFTYTVTYADVDSDVASYVRVHVDSDTTGVTMTKSGSVYTYSTTLAAGSHTYYFTASDGTDTARNPSSGSHSGPSVSEINTAPTLSSGSVSPSTGTVTTTFTYTVTYADADSDPASYVRVHIDGDTTGEAMTLSGGVYTYSTTLTKGSHNFYFTASDGTDTVREPSTGSTAGPSVANTAPTLTSGSVSPGTGYTITTFTYTVTYADADSDAASYVRVHIDSDATGVAMTKSGSVYTYSTTLGIGDHTFYFTTSDGTDTARDPASGAHSGPSGITTPPIVTTYYYAESETTVTGTVSGSYTDTLTDDDVSETITEYVRSKGKKSLRTSYLEHKWVFNIVRDDRVEFFVEATASGDEHFAFYFSIDDITYYKMFDFNGTVTTATYFSLPNSIPSPVYIMVTDMNRTGLDMSPDTVSIDVMYIGCTPDDSIETRDRTYEDIAGKFKFDNDWFATHLSDDNYEILNERESGGKPSSRYSYVEHKWTFDVTGGSVITFGVEAFHTANTEGDDFLFQYSTDGITWIDILTVTKTADDDTAQTALLDSSLSGLVYVRVVDTDQTPSNSALDSLYIDEMYIQCD